MSKIKDILKTIKTERLEFRPVVPDIENADIIFQVLKNENPKDYLYGPITILPKTKEEMLTIMSRWEKWDKDIGAGFCIFHNDKFIGFIRMQFYEHNDTFDLKELFLIKSARGNGFATETVKCFERIAFEELKANRTIYYNESGNDDSKNVALSARFHLDGIIRQEWKYPDGTFGDGMCWSKLKSEYFC